MCTCVWYVLTAGTRSFLTSSTALLILISALPCVSSTVIRTWRSSFKCSQFGFPLFCSSWTEIDRERERRWVNVTVWVCWSTSAVTQHIRGSGGERQAYTEDGGALWREAGWQERSFSQLFSFNFERTPFFNRSLASWRQRRQLALQQLISVKDG